MTVEMAGQSQTSGEEEEEEEGEQHERRDTDRERAREQCRLGVLVRFRAWSRSTSITCLFPFSASVSFIPSF